MNEHFETLQTHVAFTYLETNTAGILIDQDEYMYQRED